MRNPFRYFNSSPEVIRLTVIVAVHYNTSAREAHEVVATIRSMGCRSIPVQADLGRRK